MPTLLENDFEMQEMKIKFDGNTHLIEANTLINSMIHFTNLVREVNKDLSHDTKKVDIKIKATPEGSFLVDFVIETQNIINVVTSLFSSENVAYVSGLASVVESVYAVAKFLGGSKPQEIETKGSVTTIKNKNGDVYNFDFRGANIYLNNQTVRETISKTFETLENDDSVTGFEILDKENRSVVGIESEQFSELSNSEEELTQTQRIKNELATLSIIALHLELKKKWEFFYNGNRISAKIKDNTFLERINKGERFGKGDTMEVELEIKQEFNEEANIFVNKAYTVTRIINHIERKDLPPLRLDFPENE